MKQLKQKLYAYCHQWVDEKIALAQSEISLNQSSANEETKSSVGDKYETGRAMVQLEIEKNSTQLAEVIKLKQTLHQFTAETGAGTVRLGSLVNTNVGLFYLSVSAGQVMMDKTACICLSPGSPLGTKMRGLISGDSFSFNGKVHKIIEVL